MRIKKKKGDYDDQKKSKSHQRKQRIAILRFINLELQLSNAEIEETKRDFELPLSPISLWNGSDCCWNGCWDVVIEQSLDYDDDKYLLKQSFGARKMGGILLQQKKYKVEMKRKTILLKKLKSSTAKKSKLKKALRHHISDELLYS